MGVEKVNLTATVGKLFNLRDPFWIASCHYTTNEGTIKAWEKFEPAALTLKTCTSNPETEKKNNVHYRLEDSLHRFGKSKLNLKYSFRISKSEGTQEWLSAVKQKFNRIEAQTAAFCKAFKGFPILIKLSREMTWLPGTAEGDKLLDHLAKHGKAGIIIANSLRADVPEFIAKGEEKRLIKGVICGEHLYDGTISLIDQLKEQCDSRSIPIVASGGMVTEDQILNALRRGAKAVQLCTAFDYFEMQYYRTLRSSLRARIHAQGLSKFAVYMERLPKMGIASVQNIPFLYFERFYSKEAQQTLLADVQTSIRMDISVLSGYSLFNNKKWRAALWARFEDNLGMRFYVPHVNSEAYRAIQLSWGITDGAQIEARKDHLIKAVEGIVNLWKETAKKRKESVRERNETAKTCLAGRVCESRIRVLRANT